MSGQPLSKSDEEHRVEKVVASETIPTRKAKENEKEKKGASPFSKNLSGTQVAHSVSTPVAKSPSPDAQPKPVTDFIVNPLPTASTISVDNLAKGKKVIVEFTKAIKFGIIGREGNETTVLFKSEVIDGRVRPIFVKSMPAKAALKGATDVRVVSSFPTGTYNAPRKSERIAALKAKAPSEEELEAEVEKLSGVPSDFDLEVFRPGRTPAPGATNGRTGAFLKQATSGRAATNIPEAAREALKEATRRGHISYLKMVAAEVKQDEPLADACVNAVQRLAEKRQWKKSTQLKAAASLQGAMKILPLYFEEAESVKLGESPIWTLAMRTFQHRCKEELPNQPQAATWKQVSDAIKQTKNDAQAMALLLGWLTAARLGCIRALSKDHVKLSKDALSITFHQGKGARARGPYTVHTQPIPKEFCARWKKYFDSRDSKLFPHHLTGSSLKDALRKVDKSLEQRSIRRGALQTMAQNGASEETLMRFSGHTQVATLRRYLNWNAINSKVQEEMVSTGKALVKRK